VVSTNNEVLLKNIKSIFRRSHTVDVIMDDNGSTDETTIIVDDFTQGLIFGSRAHVWYMWLNELEN
jgi:glycosyltransferase involved in cell wall biosynthesis